MVDAGTRFLYERAFEQRVNGSTAEAVSGELRDDEVRTGHAAKFLGAEQMLLVKNFPLRWVRTEMLEYERHIPSQRIGRC
jgi:Fe(3+) dicitrate transport protein